MTTPSFQISGARVFFAAEAQKPVPELPIGTYLLENSTDQGFFLTRMNDLAVPPRIYGRSGRAVERIISFFLQSSKSVGVLASGEKGSGKTLLACQLSAMLRGEGASTVLVTQPFQGPSFLKALGQLPQGTMLLFDEFEKTYKSGRTGSVDSAGVLQVLDGLLSTKLLSVLTSNTHKVGEFLHNRPGRLRYCIQYDGLTKEEIEEFLEDNLENKANMAQAVEKCVLTPVLNYDMLSALVTEMNLFAETATESMELLNFSSPDNFTAACTIKTELDGEEYDSYTDVLAIPTVSYYIEDPEKPDSNLRLCPRIRTSYNPLTRESVYTRGKAVITVTPDLKTAK